jgi:hypothetical protein
VSVKKDIKELFFKPSFNYYYPFNSQNTSFVKFLFPTIFLIPMFAYFYGNKFGRYDDIWQAYITQKIMSKYNMCVRYGSPTVIQKRNKHNVLRDVSEEYTGIIYTAKFLENLDNINLFGASPLENMYEIADYFLLSQEEILNYVGKKILWWLTEIK